MSSHLPIPNLILLLAALGVGCGADARSDQPQTTVTSAGVGSTTGSTDGSTDGTASGTVGSGTGAGTETGGGVYFDVPAGTGSPTGGGGTGCEKIDFLFVVDNSASMETRQQALIASFPAFINSIQAKVQGQDFHIMVVDSDGDPAFACEPALHDTDPAWTSGCPPTYMPYCTAPCPSSSAFCEGYACGSHLSELDLDDRTLGCGVRSPLGGSASNQDCGLPDGRRYMTQTQPDLGQTFACAARVGVSGHWWERPVQAMLAALAPETNEPGGCNEGFLRDDAVLVIVLISDDMSRATDQDDVLFGTNGTPQEWYDELVSRKGGDPGAIAMLGIIADPDYPDGVACDAYRALGDGAKFAALLDLLGSQARTGDVCEPDYAQLFEEVVGLVDQTCDDFTPPG